MAILCLLQIPLHDVDLTVTADLMDMSTGVFAFRMLVCQFRRELMFHDVFDFWERLWAAERLADRQLKVCMLLESKSNMQVVVCCILCMCVHAHVVIHSAVCKTMRCMFGIM